MALTYRKHGGLHFVRIGRFGFSFFWSQKRKSIPYAGDQHRERLSDCQALALAAVERALQPAPPPRYTRPHARFMRATSF